LSVPSYPTHYNPLLVTNSPVLLINASFVVVARELFAFRKTQVLPSVWWVVDIANNHRLWFFIIIYLFIYLFISEEENCWLWFFLTKIRFKGIFSFSYFKNLKKLVGFSQKKTSS
jgi:hypothetical protein